MFTKSIRFMAVFGILVIIVGTSGVAHAGPPIAGTAASGAIPANAPWFTGWVDVNKYGDEVGAYPSIAFSPVDGLPYISYYNATHHTLWLAHPVASGGNCDNSGLWTCSAIATGTDVGQYSSIAFWKSPTILGYWKMGFTYRDVTNNSIKYHVFTKSFGFPGTWSIETIRSTSGATNGVGKYTSLKYTSDGSPRLSYYSWISTLGYLTYAYPVASGGNCGEGASLGKWHCDTVDAGTGVGQYASMDLDHDGQVYFSYYDAGNGNLKYAYYGGIGFCGTGNAWICSTVDSTGNVGLFTALTAPQSASDHVHIAYYDKTNGKLKYATPSSGGNCGGGAWLCLGVDTVGAGILQEGISMTMDKNGDPLIAYENASQDLAPSTLKIARPIEAVGLLTGNCGDVPPGYLFEVWQCDTLDNAAYGQGNVDVAAYTAVAVYPTSGLGLIAYFEEDSYNLTTSLKFAFQLQRVYLPFIKR
jgi:hypothetical protein